MHVVKPFNENGEVTYEMINVYRTSFIYFLLIYIISFVVNDVTLDGVTSSSDFIVADVSGSGYYVINYDDDNWKAIGQALKGNVEVCRPLDNAGGGRTSAVREVAGLARGK